MAFGVARSAIVARNGYVIGEVGKPPEFDLEVASRGTGSRDYLEKRELCCLRRARILAVRADGRQIP